MMLFADARSILRQSAAPQTKIVWHPNPSVCGDRLCLILVMSCFLSYQNVPQRLYLLYLHNDYLESLISWSSIFLSDCHVYLFKMLQFGNLHILMWRKDNKRYFDPDYEGALYTRGNFSNFFVNNFITFCINSAHI